MKKLAIAFLILTSPPALAQTQVMQPGQWEITSTSTSMSMPGMEDMPPEALAAMFDGRECGVPAQGGHLGEDLGRVDALQVEFAHEFWLALALDEVSNRFAQHLLLVGEVEIQGTSGE